MERYWKKVAGIFFLMGLVVANNCWATTTITGFRVATTAENSRLVFDVIGKPDYDFFTLANPDRLVLDVKNTHLKTHIAKNTTKNSPITNIRFRFYKNYVRIVVDLKRPVSSNNFILATNTKNYRLVIDLKKAKKMPGVLATLPLPQMKRKISPPASVNSLAVNNNQRNVNVTPVITAPTKSTSARDIIIVIDPGHGGKDPGTTGPGGIHEKDVVLAISKNLQRALNKEPGFHAELTRTGDYYISLRGRLDIARKDKADMFVAVHADAYPTSNAIGASVFALSERGATSEAARWLAEKENKSELLGGASLPDNDNVLRSVLIDLSQTNTISESLQIGTAVLRQLGNITYLHHTRVEQAAFVVLKSPDIPSLLVETGFLSTPREEEQLRNAYYQQILANAIMQGIKSYFVHNPPQGTLLAARRFNGMEYAGNE